MSHPDPRSEARDPERKEPAPHGAGSFRGGAVDRDPLGPSERTSVSPPADFESRLVVVLFEAQRRGFLGPGPVESHVLHCRAYAEAIRMDSPLVGRAVDLGTGGGIPGLYLAGALVHVDFVFIEAMGKRAEFLRWATVQLDLEPRVRVVAERAESVAWTVRESFDLVTARAFARPAVTAEIASGLLRVGGRLTVSGSEAGADGWDTNQLERLGFAPAESIVSGGYHFIRAAKTHGCPDNLPRRNGLPAKRPLW